MRQFVCRDFPGKLLHKWISELDLRASDDRPGSRWHRFLSTAARAVAADIALPQPASSQCTLIKFATEVLRVQREIQDVHVGDSLPFSTGRRERSRFHRYCTAPTVVRHT